MQFVIWGLGIRGRMLINCLRKEYIVAIIDNREDLQGTSYCGIPIITLNDYMVKYAKCFIIIATTDYVDEIKKILQENDVKRFFDLARNPLELPAYESELPFEEMLSKIDGFYEKKHFVLLGINVFSILLYDYLTTVGEKVYFIENCEDDTGGMIRELKKTTKYKFISMEDAQNQHMLVLATERYVYNKLSPKYINIEMFFRFPYLKRYRYKNLEKFKNIHSGERCFIVATGPSLKIEDLNRLHNYNEICLSVNYIYKAFSDTAWRPRYLFCEDSRIDDAYINKVHKENIEYKFLGDRHLSIVENITYPDIYIYHTYSEYYGEEGPDFSDDPNNGCFYGYTVLYQCLQFAVYMGFERIYIVGADCDFKGRQAHFYEDNIQVADLHVDKMFLAYEAAKKYADSHNIKIYNATRGGQLEVFERVDFDSLF